MFSRCVPGIIERRAAHFSDCEGYRYRLDIVWDETLPLAVVIGLNPSTADEMVDDPTVRRWKDFAARSWQCGGVRVLNLFAFRATDPLVMKAAEDPIGPENDLASLIGKATGPRVACWGTHGSHMGRGTEVQALVPNLQCLGKNADGSPKHPLYLRSDTQLIPYGASA